MSAFPASGDRPDEFLIHLKRKVPNLASTIELRFSPRTVLGSFSPQFHATLNELKALQARRFRDLIERTEDNIVRIEMGARKITDPAEIRRVSSAVKQLDESAFSFTDSERFIFPVFVYTKSDRAICLMFYIKEPPSAKPPVGKRPLPSPLWEYYVDVMGDAQARWNRSQDVRNRL